MMKRDLLSVLLLEMSSHGSLVNYWSHSEVSEVARERYFHDGQEIKFVHNTMADYFLNLWRDADRHFTESAMMTSPLSTEQLLPKDTSGYFNVRPYCQLSRHLYHAGRTETLHNLVIFNYNWLHLKMEALGLEDVLRDFDFINDNNTEIELVKEALVKSGAVIKDDINNLAAELSGNLLSYATPSNINVRKLVRQCDTFGCLRNAFVPTYSYPRLPGSSLRSTVVCPTALRSICLDMSSSSLFVKLEADSKLYRYDLRRAQFKSSVTLSAGHLYVSTNWKYAVLLEDRYKKTIKVHRMSDGSYIGQIIPVNWIETVPFEEQHKFKIEKVDVADELVAMIVASRASYVVVADLPTCQPKHIFRPDKSASLVKLSPDSNFVFSNASEQLLGFALHTGQQISAVDLLARPHKMLFNGDATRAFLLCEAEQRVVILHLEHGAVHTSYKIVFEGCLAANDTVRDIALSQAQEMLLVRADHSVLIYDIPRDVISTHVKRPSDVPTHFRLPNADFEALNFTDADFAFDDRVLVTSIFRDVLMWHVADGQLIGMLRAPVGIITEIHVDHKRDDILAYVTYSRELHLWHPKTTFGGGILIDALTAPVVRVAIASHTFKALAICEASDELGVVDLNTGVLTDLYTHEGQVLRCAITPCGQYAMVAIRPKRSQTALIIWSLKDRQIVKELGNHSGHFMAFSLTSSFLHVSQEELSFEAAHHISIITCANENAVISQPDVQVQHVLSEPFLTSDDQRLVLLSAADYIDKKAFYVKPTIFTWEVQTSATHYIESNTLSKFTRVGRVIEVNLRTSWLSSRV